MADSETFPAADESRQQRWLKYGLNVLVMTIVAVVLVGLLTFLAEKYARRIDTTLSGAQSLSPQTTNIIRENKNKIHIVALYPKLKSEEGQQDFYQPIVDLLNNYDRGGNNVTSEIIDPATEPDKFKKLVSDITNKYGGELKSYKSLTADIDAQCDVISKYSHDEIQKLNTLPFDQLKDENLYDDLSRMANGIALLGVLTDGLKESVKSDLEQPVPSYKEASDRIGPVFSAASETLTRIPDRLVKIESNPALPKEFKAYIPDAIERAKAAKKTADLVADRVKNLPPLKESEEFRDQLKNKTVVVMGDNGYKIIQDRMIWLPEEKAPFGFKNDDQHKFRFAGEQQISMAIASLADAKKRMVVFVRPAGMQSLIGSMGGEGMFSEIGNRLRDYNFEVAEKQAGPIMEQPREPQMPEPTEEQMKSAIWIVVNVPSQNQMQMQMGSPIEPMLAEHLKQGGSALVLFTPAPDPGNALPSVFGPLGVSIGTDKLLVHESANPGERRSSDIVAMYARANQLVFLGNQYGKHQLAAPLQDLDFMMRFASPVKPAASIPAGVTVTPLLPVPRAMHSWAVTIANYRKRMEAAKRSGDDTIAFNASEDTDNTTSDPLYFGAAIDKTGAGRVVIIGSLDFLSDQMMTLPDEKNPDAMRLPGNSEFVMDSIFWLAHRDAMLAISPHALQMARVKAMSPAKLNFYRAGVLTAGLPLAVIVAGLLVFLKRRD